MGQKREGGVHHGKSGFDSDNSQSKKSENKNPQKEDKVLAVVYGKEFETKALPLMKKS